MQMAGSDREFRACHEAEEEEEAASVFEELEYDVCGIPRGVCREGDPIPSHAVRVLLPLLRPA
jgi:hypothetical protein